MEYSKKRLIHDNSSKRTSSLRVLLVASAVLFAISISFALSRYTDTQFDWNDAYVSSFVTPLCYFAISGIGFASMWLLNRKGAVRHERAVSLLLCFSLTYFVYLLRDFSAPSPVGSDASAVSEISERIAGAGGFSIGELQFSYPGYFAFSSSASQISGLDSSATTHVMLLVISIEFSLLILVFFKVLGLPARKAPVFMFFFVILTSILFDFQVAPQFFAYFSSLVILFLLVIRARNRSSLRIGAIIAVAAAGMIITHPTTPLIAIGICFALAAFGTKYSRRSRIITGTMVGGMYAFWLTFSGTATLREVANRIAIGERLLREVGPSSAFQNQSATLFASVENISQLAGRAVFLGMLFLAVLILAYQLLMKPTFRPPLQKAVVLGISVAAIPLLIYDASGAHMFDRLSAWAMLALIPPIGLLPDMKHPDTASINLESQLTELYRPRRTSTLKRRFASSLITVLSVLIVVGCPIVAFRLNVTNDNFVTESEMMGYDFVGTVNSSYQRIGASPPCYFFVFHGDYDPRVHFPREISMGYKIDNLDVIVLDHFYVHQSESYGFIVEVADYANTSNIIFDNGMVEVLSSIR